MSRIWKWMIAPLGLAIALAAMAVFSGSSSFADDAPATQPSPAKGSITVKVVDSTGQPATRASVQLSLAPPPATNPSTAPAGGGRGRGRRGGGAPAGPALASGSTDDSGSFTFTDIAAGDYEVTATSQGATPMRGRGRVTLGADGKADLTVNLSAGRGGRRGRGQGGGGNGGGNGG